ncbi:MAG: ATP-binding protein, partial [Flavobacteriaceae bacterium]
IENLLRQIAVDYFRGEDAKISTDHFELRKRRRKEAEVLKKRAASLRARKKALKKALEEIELTLSGAEIHEVAAAVLEKFRIGVEKASKIVNPAQAGKAVLALETDARLELEALTNRLTFQRPRGFQPAKKDQKTMVRLEAAKKEFVGECIVPIETYLAEVIEDLVTEGTIEFAASDRILSPIHERAEQSLSEANKIRQQLNGALEKLVEQAKSTASLLIREMKDELETVKIDATSTVDLLKKEQDLLDVRETALQRIRNRAADTLERLSDLLAQVDSLDLSGNIEDSHLTVAEALEGEAMILQEKLEKFSEWAQVGMAIGIVQHEFSGHSRSLYGALKKLKPWAEKNEKLAGIFNQLVTSFQHLESYLQLFLPLNRRMHRTAIEISGHDISEFVKTIFQDMLAENSIDLMVTPAFEKHCLKSYPSSIYPVFVNLVDNAIYWLNEGNGENKKIVFDSQHDSIVVSNSGPGIDIADQDDIFEFGFSNKKSGGTGLGMAISRDVLNRVGMDIRLAKAGTKISPSFVIEEIQK